MNISVSSWARFRELVLFVAVGITNTGVDFGVLNLLILLTHHDQGWWLLPFDGFSFFVAVINSYVLNGRFTFRNRGSGGFRRFFHFFAISAVGLFINIVVVWAFSSPLSRMLPPVAAINLSKVLATALSLFWNYFAMRRWIFSRKKLVAGDDNNGNSLVPIVTVPCARPVVVESETTSTIIDVS